MIARKIALEEQRKLAGGKRGAPPPEKDRKKQERPSGAQESVISFRFQRPAGARKLSDD
jgi:hypothetical protein